ncbi:MAG: putative capsid protein [Cressdnaviricota sp.]|nr:MAG: putative capsid protein [Cressdnaviricota sp.]
MKRASTYNARAPPAKRRRTSAKSSKVNLSLLQRKVNQLSRGVETKVKQFIESGPMLVSGSGPTWQTTVGLSDIAQGAGDQERIGSKVMATGISFSFLITPDRRNLKPFTYRVVVFRDKQHSNSASLAAQGPYGGQTAPFQTMTLGNEEVAVMPYNWDMRGRYQFYRDKTHTLNPVVALDYDPTNGNTSEIIPEAYVEHFDIKFPSPIPIYYTGAGGTNAEVSTNMFQIGIYASQNNVAFQPDISIGGYLYFTD